MPKTLLLLSLLLPLGMLSGIALAVGTSSERIVVRSEQDLPKTWKVANPQRHADLLTVSGTQLRYGCINVAYLIESNGKVADNIRLLAYRTDRALPADENPFHSLGDFLKRAISDYTPASEITAPAATYTSRSIPVFGKRTETALSAEQQAALKAALHKSCTIDDLPGRLRDGPKRALQLGPLPSLEVLLGSSANSGPITH
jgi:hypothetical protein